LAEDEAPWNGLLARSAAPAPFFGPAWFETYLDKKHPSARPWWCVFLLEGGSLRGVLPLVPDLRHGGGVRVPAEYFMEDGAPVLEPGREGEIARALLEAVYARIPEAHRIAFGELRADAATYKALAALPRTTSRRDGEGAAVRIHGDFKVWYERIGSNMRRNLRKAANRVTRDFGAPPSAEFLTSPDTTTKWLDTLAAIERAGWKGASGVALGGAPNTQALYEDVVQRWQAEGVLQWHRLALGGQTAALHMAVRLGTKLTLVRICFDERFARYSPSGLLLRATFERVFSDGGIRRVDCVQHQHWQRNWRMDEVPYRRLYAHSPGLATMIGGLWPERLADALSRNRPLRRILHRE